MRSALLLLVVVATATANYGWQTGREFSYEYKTRSIAGIPSLENQVSGLALRSHVKIQVPSAEWLIVEMIDNGIARVENQLFAGQSWRQGLPLSYSPVESQMAEILRQPFKVQLQQGKVVQLLTAPQEPMWSVNIKRGLASQLSLNMEAVRPSQQQLSQNAINGQEESAAELTEASVAGVCKTRYTTFPVQEYVARTVERDQPQELKEKVRQMGPAYVIAKTKDYSHCQHKPAFLHSSMVDENAFGTDAAKAQHKRYSARTSTTRYLLRGEPKHNFRIEYMWAESEYLVRPFATKTENILVVSNQTLVLKDVQSIRNPIQLPSLVERSLVYEQVPRQQQRQGEQEGEFAETEYLLGEAQSDLRYLREERQIQEQEQQYQQYSQQYPTLTGRPVYSQMRQMPVQRIQEQIKELVEKVQQEIQSTSQLGEKQPSHMVDLISRALTALNLEEIEQVYRQLVPTPHPQQPQMKLRKQILVDAIAMCGTNPAVMLLKEKIVKREIKGEMASQLIMTLPVTMKTPTPEILKQLVKMTEQIKDQEQVWTTALLATSNVIYRACVNPMVKEHAYGISARSFCSKSQVQIFLPYLREELYKTQNPSRMIPLIKAIGNLGVYETLEVLRPIITGKQTSEKQVRTQAIFALGRLAATTPEKQILKKIQALLSPIHLTPVEEPQVRVAAFVTILSTRPDEPFFTEAATNTWFEQSQHYGQFVYSTLENLANSTYPSQRNISRMASVALPLCKPFRLGAQYSQNLIFSHSIPSRNIASYLQYAQVSSKYSLVPEVLYFKSKSEMGGFDMPNFEFALQAQGIQTLINKLVGPLNREELSTSFNIHTRKDAKPEGSLWLKAMGQMERVITMDTLRSLAREGIIEYESQNQFRVNFQKTLPLQDSYVIFPAESGLEIYALQKAPAMVSVQGKIQLQTEGRFNLRENQYPEEIKIKTDLKPFLCMTRVLEAGIISPFSEEIFAAGHKTHALLNLPGQVEAKVYPQKKQVEIIAERATQAPTKVEIAQFKAYPYTVQAKLWNFVQWNARPIMTQAEPVKMYNKFGQQTLGLSFEATQKVDQPFNDMAGFYHVLQPHSILSAAQFFSVPHSLKAFEYKLQLDLPQSETKEVRINLKYKTEKREWNINSFETEKQLEGEYYEQKSQQHYDEIRSETEQYFANPLSVMPECEESESQCREILQRMINRNPEARRWQESQGSETEYKKESHVHSVHGEVVLAGSEPRRFRASAVVAASPNMKQQKLSVLFEKVQSSRQQPFRVCANGQIKFPELPLKREQLIDAPKTVLGHLTVKYGRQCEESKIQARVVMAQSEEQKEAARSLPIARECRQHEQTGSPYSPACMMARRQASLLNKVVIDIEAKNTPKALRNMTLHLDDLVKYALYPHMTNKRIDISNPEKKVKIVLDFLPIRAQRSWTVLDAYLYKPKENTFYQKIRLTPVAEAFLPFSAQTPFVEKALNNLMSQQYAPVCKVQQKMITTFDNVSYAYPLSECYHLIAKDCSQQIPVQAFAKKVAEGKQILLQVGQMKVELTPERKVIVNGQPVNVELYGERVFRDEQIRQTVLRVQKPVQKEIEVFAPVHGIKIRTDGQHFDVQFSNIYRGRVCGLCGDMNGEKVAELKDPQGCIRQTPELFARSWAVEGCAQRAPKPARCLREQTYVAPEGTQEYLEQRSSYGQPQGVAYITKVVNRGSEVCFSTKPVPECSIGHKHTNSLDMEVKFHCVQRGHAANQLVNRAREGILEEMFEKRPDFQEWLSVPEACHAIAEQQY